MLPIAHGEKVTSPSDTLSQFVTAALGLAKANDAEAIVLLTEVAADWKALKKKCGVRRLIVAASKQDLLDEAVDSDVSTVFLDIPEATLHDRLTQAILESVAKEYVTPGSVVVSMYSGFDQEDLDSISVFRLNERLGRLSARDLRRLETNVPLDTLKVVVDLAVEIGRDGREGKPVGTIFVVGDHRKVLEQSQPAGFDFVKGYTRKERSLFDGGVRENVKELAQLDGAFIIAADGTVESAARIIDTTPVELTMTTGLGSRHYSGAAISKNTNAVAVVVSESNGTVRIFQNGADCPANRAPCVEQ